MRVALIHYWLVTWRGGERVLKAIADLFPDADVFTHVADPDLVAREFPGRTVRTTFIARLPFARRGYQRYLPLMPLALEQLDLRDYDLVISSESGPAKGVIVAPHATHVCYCHSPMRYLWDQYHEYSGAAGPLTRFAMAPAFHYVRHWDQLSAQRVDHFVANSAFVASRIRKYYRREAEVIHPPVAVERFAAHPAAATEDYYLWVGQLVPYKRPDLLIDAFNALDRPLVVIGDGPMLASLKRRASPRIRFLSKQTEATIADHYARCRAVVFPGVEDFGIVPVEAIASGTPVIAFDRGGVRETVRDRYTGLLFQEQSVPALIEAVRTFEALPPFDRALLRADAQRFSETRFKAQFAAQVDKVLSNQTERAN
ncbi:MAG: glycosyltransferase [Gammaproteobacteria bacterium]|nr:glycosyltransferase [Gammaproteobacteria bacterium]